MKVTGETKEKIHTEGTGRVQLKEPSIVPLYAVKDRETLQRFYKAYKDVWGELDFCTTCEGAVKEAIKKLNTYYGYV